MTQQNQKKLWLGLVLVLIFGPLGMAYASVAGSIVMMLAMGLVGVFVAKGIFAVWAAGLVWAPIAVHRYNKQHKRG